MAYLNEKGLAQVFEEVKKRIEAAQGAASSAGTTAASNVQKNLDSHTGIENKGNTSGAHGYNKGDLKVSVTAAQGDATQYYLGATVTDGYGNSYTQANGGARIDLVTTPSSSDSTGKAGLMSPSDKSKLDGIAANANNYSLSTATKSTLGGIKIGYTTSGNNRAVQVDADGNAFVVQTDTTYSNATTGAAGLMSATDKQQLTQLYTTNNLKALTVDSSGLISSTNLPSYVDDVLLFDGTVSASAPTSGVTNLTADAAKAAVTAGKTVGIVYSTSTKGFLAFVMTPASGSTAASVQYYTTWDASVARDNQYPLTATPEVGKIYVDTTGDKKVYRYGSSSTGLITISDVPEATLNRITTLETKVSTIGSAITTDEVTSSAEAVFGD